MPPGLAGGTSRFLPPGAADRAVADDDAELQELAPDALGAPQGVGPRRRPDQVPRLTAQSRPSAGRARSPAPEQPPALSVPPDHGVGGDQDEVPAPPGHQLARQHPEEL